MITTRFAPSPTGLLHIGGARTALFSYLYAKKNKGNFLLRIEDTDITRSTPESVQAIFDGMKWLGLHSDKPVVFQTQRFERYKEVAKKLVDDGLAYWCYCSISELEKMKEEQKNNNQKPKYNGLWRPETGKIQPPIPDNIKPVLRFKNPIDDFVIVNDMIKGDIRFSNEELDDLIILRSDGTPTYNFCVVVDDYDMGVSHVVRGEDHVNNTPRQINILKALKGDIPAYAHVPLIFDQNGKKVSKRDGAASILNYREEGYLPSAVLNYLLSLGWASDDGTEIFSLPEMIEKFDLQRVQISPARLNPDKLNWFNQNHLKLVDNLEHSPDVLNELMYHFDKEGLAPDIKLLQTIFNLQKERTTTLTELVKKSIFFFKAPTEYKEKDMEKHVLKNGNTILNLVKEKLENIKTWDSEHIHTCLFEVAKENELKIPEIMQPIRIALVGYAISPPVDSVLEVLGLDESLLRIRNLISKITPKVIQKIS